MGDGQADGQISPLPGLRDLCWMLLVPRLPPWATGCRPLRGLSSAPGTDWRPFRARGFMQFYPRAPAKDMGNNRHPGRGGVSKTLYGGRPQGPPLRRRGLFSSGCPGRWSNGNARVHILPRPKAESRQSCRTGVCGDLNNEVAGVNRQLPFLFHFECNFANPDGRFNQQRLELDSRPICAGRTVGPHVF